MIADEPILLRHENSPELKLFVLIDEFALKKNDSLRLKSWNDACPECLCFYCIPGGKPGWLADPESYIFYTAKFAIILPGQEQYAADDCLETRSPYRLHRHLNIQQAGNKNSPGDRSNTSQPEFIYTRKLFPGNVPALSNHRMQDRFFSCYAMNYSVSRLDMPEANHILIHRSSITSKALIRYNFSFARIKTNRIYGYVKKIISLDLLHRSNNFITGFYFYHLSENA